MDHGIHLVLLLLVCSIGKDVSVLDTTSSGLDNTKPHKGIPGPLPGYPRSAPIESRKVRSAGRRSCVLPVWTRRG